MSQGAEPGPLGGARPHWETVFRIGSLSKQFVATAIMMLVEEGTCER